MSFDARILSSVLCALLSLLSVTDDSRRTPSPSSAPHGSGELPVAAAARRAGAGARWWQEVSARLELEEYRASLGPDGLQAPNRAHNLRAFFRQGAIDVEPRRWEARAPWRFSWRTARWGRRGEPMQAVGPVAPAAEREGSRTAYRREGFVEWYENTKAGLEQGFTIQARPPGKGPLCLEGRLGGGLCAEQRAAEGAVDFLDANGACVLRYADLRAWDVDGRDLPSRLEVDADELAILVDDRGARYPVTVDPLMTSPAWTGDSNQASARFGHHVAVAGDVNGDGYSDVIVGAESYDNGQLNEGRAYVYHGSASGLAAAPAWTAESDQAEASFGISVATAGDVNGDGYADVLVGASTWANGQANEGRAYAFLGSPAGLASNPSWTVESNDDFAFLGFSVATAGDVNGDGYDDVIIGAPRYTDEEFEEGRALVYLGSAVGLATSPVWTAESNQVTTDYGVSVATAGDVNADGYSDVLVGASLYDNGQGNEGRAYLYLGSAAGPGAAAAWTAESNQAGALFGFVSTAGDVNGDGYSDAIVGAEFYDNGQTDEGRVYLYQGSAAGLATSAAWTAESNQADAAFGRALGTAGDVNGDGFADVIIGAQFYDNGQTDEGRAYVYQGSAAGLGSLPIWTAESDQASAELGYSVGTAGDVNGDGYSDVIAGAPSYDTRETDAGQAFVYHGLAAGLAGAAAWSGESNQASAEFGYSVGTAGDVNGDGFSDVIVSAYLFDNGQVDEGRALVYHGSAAGIGAAPAWTAEPNQASAFFGISVGTASDVNGDGYSDVIIGALLYDNGGNNEGGAFVYHGSPMGLGAAPAWVGDPNQDDSRFGRSVGTAGDVNGDGFADVIVGAFLYDNGENVEGRAFVYHGSATGLSASPAWTGESNQEGAWFGYSVGTAGDVNGDGFSDVIVGASGYDNGQNDEGRSFVFTGSAMGLAATPAWTAESDQDGAELGVSVGTAGDVNGDGYSDVIVGAHAYDNQQVGEGRAYVYHGSAMGPNLSPDWITESNQNDAFLGWSVGTAGDVNGDGYSDVIVGAHLWDSAVGPMDVGRATVHHGSAMGLATSPAWTAASNQFGAEFGWSVKTAGDVNGDGFSDVIIGARWYDNGQTDEGQGYLYYGNEGDGLDRKPRQARTDDSAPIDLLGRSDSDSAFRLKALGRTPAGRGKVRLQWEVKPAGVLFDGTGVASGPELDTGTPAGSGSAVPLSELALGLIDESLYHWRLRIVADSPFFPHSPWLWLPYNAASEADVRTATASTAVASSSDAAGVLWLEPVAPNPFVHHGSFVYALPYRGRHRLALFDVTGREVALLASGWQEAGRHTVGWDGRRAGGIPLPAGVYFLRLEFAGRMEARKLVVAR